MGTLLRFVNRIQEDIKDEFPDAIIDTLAYRYTRKPTAVTKPHKDMLIYAAAKAAQVNMVQNLAKQFAPYGVTVNNIAPGVIETPRNTAVLTDESYKEKVLAGIPASYIGRPDDCSGQILLLCSDAGRYITGEDIFIDGGMQL